MQFFLQTKLMGIDAFLRAAGPSFPELLGRARAASAFGELVAPALLDRFALSHELVGAASLEGSLLMFPGEMLAEGEAWLRETAQRLAAASGGHLRLVWSYTEALGDWSDIRKRMKEHDARNSATPWSGGVPDAPPAGESYAGAAAARGVAFDRDAPGLLRWSEEGSLPFATHTATRDGDDAPAGLRELGERAEGRPMWGVLRADVDDFRARLRRCTTVEEHRFLAVLYKKFFEGELQVACMAGPLWRKVTMLYTGGDSFAVIGAWDGLLGLAREMQRLFHTSLQTALADAVGPEGRTISMAIALAPDAEASPAAVYEAAGRQLETAKSIGKDSISLFGRVLEWKQLSEAADLKQTMLRLVNEFGSDPQYLSELASFYRDSEEVLQLQRNRTRAEVADRPWRFHRRLSRMLEERGPQDREFEKAKGALLGEFIRRRQGHVKLRPAGRVALEWARLAAGESR